MKMCNKELIDILSDYINQRKTDNVNLTNNQENTAVIRGQGIGGIIYKQTGLSEYKSDYYSCIYQYENSVKLIKEIQNIFNDNNIRYFIVKGPVIARYYPNIFLRTMGDVDITIHQEDMHIAAKALENGGYIFDESEFCRNFEWHFSKNGFNFELHHALLYGERVNDEKFVEYFNNCWNYVLDNKLDSSYHFLYVIFHMRKHFMNGGFGIRFFLDLALLSKSDEIDWDFVQKELSELKMLDFTRICLAVCEKCFEISSNFESICISDEFFLNAITQIFDGGVFGQSIFSKESVKATNLMRKKGESGKSNTYIIQAVAYCLHTLFPSYKEMSEIPQYSYLRRQHILLPFAWMHRVIHECLHRPHEAWKELKAPFIYSNDIQSREKLYKEWKI